RFHLRLEDRLRQRRVQPPAADRRVHRRRPGAVHPHVHRQPHRTLGVRWKGQRLMSQTTTDLAKPAKPAETFLPISGARKFKNRAAAVVFTVCFLLAVIPLVALLYKVISAGLPAVLNPTWWTNSLFLVAPSSMAGGVGHAIYGSLVQALIAAIISIPLGVAAGIMLVE